MQPPCELMTNYFLPNMRGLVSHNLHESGESQRQIAILLGITQARVSYYLGRRKTTFANELTSRFAIDQNDVMNYSKVLSEDVKRSQVDGIFTLYSIWKNLLFSGAICSSHQRESNIQSDCSVCMELHKPARESVLATDTEAEDSAIVREISEAIALIENSTQFPYLMPEVSVNIAMSRKHPKTSRDIAAIPGRLNKIHGRAKAFVMPEFGCSNHMSKVLLIFHSRNQNFRAVLNLKYDKSVEKTLEQISLPKFFTEQFRMKSEKMMSPRFAHQDVLLKRLESTKLPTTDSVRTVAVIDRGSEGVEPITYLLGVNATEITEVAIRMARAYTSQLSSES